MAKKVILFLSAFLLFFCFAFVKAEEATSTTDVIIDDSSPIPILYNESSTSKDMLISPAPENIVAKQEDVKTIKDREFLKQCSLSKCRIPIPTLKNPDNKIFNQDQKIYLTGLTWNNTIIDVYVDGNYVGSAVVRNDEKSNTANFYLEFENNLSVGNHSWSVIAWSLNQRDRSLVSKENLFTIKSSTAIKQTDTTQTDGKDESEESTSSISEQNEDINVISSESETPVSVLEDQTESEVSVTSSESNNMLVVENKKSDEQVNKSEDTENLQSATVSEEQKQEIEQELAREDLNTDNVQNKNKNIGIILLGALILIVMFSIFFRKKK